MQQQQQASAATITMTESENGRLVVHIASANVWAEVWLRRDLRRLFKRHGTCTRRDDGTYSLPLTEVLKVGEWIASLPPWVQVKDRRR